MDEQAIKAHHDAQTHPDPEAGPMAAQAGVKAEGGNENSAMSFWSSSNSDSDDLDDNGREGQTSSDPTRK